MSRGRRALALTVLSLVLGVLAASDVAGREAALDRRIGPATAVVVARVDLPAGAVLGPRVLAVRRLPARYAPRSSFGRPGQLAGLVTAAPVPAGADVTAALVRDPAAVPAEAARGVAGALRAGQRVAEVVARGDAQLIGPGSRIDLLVTREAADGSGGTTLALEDAEVLAAAPAPGGGGGRDDGAPRVALSLRVSLREAVALAAAQNFAKELRVLVRSDGDRRRGAEGLTVRDGGG
ncbi:SAF domain-containing protein [Paraconexibacter antarcticus]|uniref:SAF domain-containing protein n=1 Tax=Paraconexibacter antarcticus TaxID=2949664 RepID=A0ABY5DQV3_9ACTN|nr:SAF domain-containing protein [Paraconexibacter antarcticus]UTI63182.1 SAF domain-containing protein [Paraconexibacter antarcticus]